MDQVNRQQVQGAAAAVEPKAVLAIKVDMAGMVRL